MELIVGFLLLSFGFFMGWVTRSRLPGIPDIDEHYPLAAPSPERMAQITNRNRVASMLHDQAEFGAALGYPPGATADQILGMDVRDSIAMDVAMQLPIDPVAYGIAIEGLPESIPYDDPLIGTILQAYREGIADECELYLQQNGLTRCKLHGNRAWCPKPNLTT